LVLLERRGLVERRPHPTDGRARGVALTREGRSVFKKAWSLSESTRRQLLDGMAPDQVTSLVQSLKRLSARLEQESTIVPELRRRSASRAVR
jgi:DNA-binding MarR family transcriptional regulator